MIRIVVDESAEEPDPMRSEACEVVDAAGNRLGFIHAGVQRLRVVRYADEELSRIDDKASLAGHWPTSCRDLDKRASKFAVLWSDDADARLANA